MVCETIFFFIPHISRNFEDWAKKRFEQKLAKKREEASSGGLSASQAGADQKSSEDRFEEWQEQTEKNSIPRQLQKLFLRLQLGDTRAESTEVKPHSFGLTFGIDQKLRI